MGQKVNPVGIRLGIIKDWTSTWYAGNQYADYLNTDMRVRAYLQKKLVGAGVSRIQIRTTCTQCANYYLQRSTWRYYWKKRRRC